MSYRHWNVVIVTSITKTLTFIHDDVAVLEVSAPLRLLKAAALLEGG